MLMGEILANEMVLALSHLLLLRDFDCSLAADRFSPPIRISPILMDLRRGAVNCHRAPQCSAFDFNIGQSENANPIPKRGCSAKRAAIRLLRAFQRSSLGRAVLRTHKVLSFSEVRARPLDEVLYSHAWCMIAPPMGSEIPGSLSLEAGPTTKCML